MKKTLLLLAFALATDLGAQQSGIVTPPPLPAVTRTTPFDFSIKNIMRGPELYGRPPQQVAWSADGRWIYFRWVEPGTDWRETAKPYRVRATPGSRPERVPDAALDTVGPLLQSGDFSPRKDRRAVEYQGDIFVIDIATAGVRRLTETIAREGDPSFSADGTRIFFVRDNNVFSVDVNGGSLRQHTDIRFAGAADSARRADSVRQVTQRGFLEAQQRELFEAIRDRVRADSIRRADSVSLASRRLSPINLGRNERLSSLSVSPSGNSMVVVLTTQPATDAARQAAVPQYVTESGYTEELRIRTKVGDVQGRSRIGLISLPSGRITWIRAFGGDTALGFTRTVGWNESGAQALLFSRSFDNKTRTIHTVGPTGALQVVDVLRDSAWVGGQCFDCAGWYDEGRRIWFVSEADGFAHLYTARPDGSDKRQLTSGRWEVRGVRLSRDEQSFYMHTNEPSPAERHFYRMSVNGGARERITSWSGAHDIAVSPDERWLADVYSHVNQPPDLFLLENRPGAAMNRLTISPSDEWRSFTWIKPAIVMIPASDGAQVPAHIYRPSDMGAQPNGAAVIFVHGAGYLQNVGNFWSEYPREYMFNQLLASKGFVVLDLDYRASSGYGRDWRTAVYRWMGGRDLQDQVDASRWLERELNIPGERVGIYGGSYGGFITLMALFTEADRFGAGAALRSVTDWAHYNEGYTANILNRPQGDSLAYRRSSPIYFAEGLRDPLVILHGMVDVNVHFQDVVRLTQRLIELGKTGWELAVYPVEDHGFVRPSSWTDEYRRIYEIFDKNLPVRRAP